MDSEKNKYLEKVPDQCPHCGYHLNRWQQVLLQVDRATTCKNCWYRIYLSPASENPDSKQKFEDE